ncbi:hydrolase [Acetobacter aceti NRIC 0242]|uniref:Phosphatase n=1 Tax=Acetobacter aceti NBRC 14818 TaxID=887700 RepID=A0AB33IFZ7_ACEAC|nr:HAD family phosphatase [Acetobacter aceti]TCS34645.1 HAD superfamily hydrolase (TIGR01509 family) [Acetobacter aceti NBRC 14818]BCK77070.1 phosphatase [Acetobacter aceti NBRC 14818]GAN56511.1 hydrolase/phosphatase/phosphohexomutase [Acetobacter aceti NBRC 14818]GBO79519.1 hydrolase [Acetobacter aceti NRIC 0242]
MQIAAGTEALIFDCDGTLVDSLPLYLASWLEALKSKGGLDVSPEWFFSRRGYSEGMVLSELEKTHGITLNRAAIMAATREGVRNRLPGVKQNVPVVALVREWAGRLPRAVASSGSREVVEASLAAIGLLEVFDAIVTIEDVERPKPAPDIYLLAAKRLGVKPSGCLVFEDSTEGLEAAHAAGMAAEDVRPWSDFRGDA